MRWPRRTPRSSCRPNTPTTRRSSPSRSTSTNRLRDDPADTSAAHRTPAVAGRSLGARGLPGALIVAYPEAGTARPLLVAILGPTATGKSTLAIRLATLFDGEVVSCDSTAVYRGFDIGTDKVPAAEQQGVRHHMVDVADPDEEYSAARYAREAAAVVRDITSRGKLPILAGGTGLYYRALTRGFFPGPSRDVALRERLEAIAARRGPERLHR